MINEGTRPVTRIHQIELSSICNLKCKYCAYPKMKRAKEHMSMETFKRALEHVKHYKAIGAEQRELSLTGVGEALLNPEFLDMAKLAREALPDELIIFSTNGILLKEDIVKELRELQVGIFVSTHRPEVAAPAINLARKYNLLAGVNTSFATEAFNWAGQVDWEVSAKAITCDYLYKGWAVVLQDGTVTTCCMDAEGFNKVGSVYNAVGSLALKPAALCDSCHMVIPADTEFKKVI